MKGAEMYIKSLFGFKIQVPAKAGELEWIWRHWLHAEHNIETFDHAQELRATPLQNLEAIIRDFSYFSYPYGAVAGYPGEDLRGYRDTSYWQWSGKVWVMECSTQIGHYIFTFNLEKNTLRVVEIEDGKFGKTTVRVFNL